MADEPTSWPAVISGALLLWRWITRSEVFLRPEPPHPEPDGEPYEFSGPDLAPDEDGLAYRGRLVEQTPGSGRYRPVI